MGIRPPSILFSILLSCILVIPFLCKLFFIEPFPAIIMPSGHGKIHINENIITQFKYQCLVYENEDSTEIELQTLFSGIPYHYFPNIIKNNIGFSKNSDSYSSNFYYMIMPWKKKTLKKLSELKKYYIKNVSRPVDSLKIKTFLVERSVLNGEIVQEELFSQKTFKLE